MLNCIAVGVGGFLGAVCRYLVGLIPVRETTLFPVRTFAVNLAGCLVIALLAVLAERRLLAGPRTILFLKTGLCGGFTTFSTFALETSDLIRAGEPGVALLYAVLSVTAGVAAVFLTEFLCGRL